jgi:hypothetical protein
LGQLRAMIDWNIPCEQSGEIPSITSQGYQSKAFSVVRIPPPQSSPLSTSSLSYSVGGKSHFWALPSPLSAGRCSGCWGKLVFSTSLASTSEECRADVRFLGFLHSFRKKDFLFLCQISTPFGCLLALLHTLSGSQDCHGDSHLFTTCV